MNTSNVVNTFDFPNEKEEKFVFVDNFYGFVLDCWMLMLCLLLNHKICIMKKYILLIFVLLFSVTIYSQVRVKGYYRKNGTYVQPHVRSNPNRTKSDNWSTKGNVNPYTGKKGTKNVDYNNRNGSNYYKTSTKSTFTIPHTTHSNYSGTTTSHSYNSNHIDKTWNDRKKSGVK